MTYFTKTQKGALKEIPKKATIINNLLNREDDNSLAVKTTEKGKHTIYWEKKNIVHTVANKELLSLLGKEELYPFITDMKHELSKEFNIGTFKFDVFYPSRQKNINTPSYAREENKNEVISVYSTEQLKNLLNQTEKDMPIAAQVVAENGDAWNMWLSLCEYKGTMVVQMKHEELKFLHPHFDNVYLDSQIMLLEQMVVKTNDPEMKNLIGMLRYSFLTTKMNLEKLMENYIKAMG